jgi:alginate O-acetyltransferase complex protein AlgI
MRRERVPLVVQHVVTLVLVLIGWVLFRATSATQAFDFIAAMFGYAPGGSHEALPPDAVLFPRFAIFAFVAGIAISVVPIVAKYRDLSKIRVPAFAFVLARAGFIVLFIASAMHLTNMRITPLIYFKF